MKNDTIKWSKEKVYRILRNEKYSGDLMMQKTYRTDCISKKIKKNNGELPKYLISNNHPAIIDGSKFNLVQIEMSRRSNKTKKSVNAKTEQGKYSGKYVLTEILICGECGSSYRRREKNKNGKKQYFWRCINRLENGKESCDTIGVEEQKLKKAICKCLNNMFEQQNDVMQLLERKGAMILCYFRLTESSDSIFWLLLDNNL